MNKVQLTRIFNVSAPLLWEVLTDRKHLSKWYFTFTEDWNLEIDHAFEWSAGDLESKQWVHRGVFKEVVKDKKLVHSWAYPGYSGTSTLSWELKVIDENHTELTLTHVFDIPFDTTVKELKQENFEGGWNYFLNEGLVNYLNKLN